MTLQPPIPNPNQTVWKNKKQKLINFIIYNFLFLNDIFTNCNFAICFHFLPLLFYSKMYNVILNKNKKNKY